MNRSNTEQDAVSNKVVFVELIREFVQSISDRHPEYFSCSDILFPPVDRLSEEYGAIASLRATSRMELEVAMVRGIQVVDDLKLPVRLCSETNVDLVSTMLSRIIADAYCAAKGQIPLRPTSAIARQNCSEKQTPGGVRYTISPAGLPAALLVIPDLGMQRTLTRLLEDQHIARRKIMVIGRLGSESDALPISPSLDHDVDNILDVLTDEATAPIDVLGCGRGCRVALRLSERCPEKVRSLTLVSPALRDASSADAYPSPYEENLEATYQSIKDQPALGSDLLSSFANVELPDLTGIRFASYDETRTVLQSPPRSSRDLLNAPFSTVANFVRYMDRILADQRYDIRPAIQKAQCPITLLMGTHDKVVNTELCLDRFSEAGSNAISLTLLGSGHHLPLTDYMYLTYTLAAVLNGFLPQETARLSVNRFPMNRVCPRTH